jgi:hypothetical protein
MPFLRRAARVRRETGSSQAMNSRRFDDLPDVRDGLTRKERVVLYCLDQIQKERGGRNVPTAMLYGRVVEHVDISVNELQLILQRLCSFNAHDPQR